MYGMTDISVIYIKGAKGFFKLINISRICRKTFNSAIQAGIASLGTP